MITNSPKNKKDDDNENVIEGVLVSKDEFVAYNKQKLMEQLKEDYKEFYTRFDAFTTMLFLESFRTSNSKRKTFMPKINTKTPKIDECIAAVVYRLDAPKRMMRLLTPEEQSTVVSVSMDYYASSPPHKDNTDVEVDVKKSTTLPLKVSIRSEITDKRIAAVEDLWKRYPEFLTKFQNQLVCNALETIYSKQTWNVKTVDYSVTTKESSTHLSYLKTDILDIDVAPELSYYLMNFEQMIRDKYLTVEESDSIESIMPYFKKDQCVDQHLATGDYKFLLTIQTQVNINYKKPKNQPKEESTSKPTRRFIGRFMANDGHPETCCSLQ